MQLLQFRKCYRTEHIRTDKDRGEVRNKKGMNRPQLQWMWEDRGKRKEDTKGYELQNKTGNK